MRRVILCHKNPDPLPPYDTYDTSIRMTQAMTRLAYDTYDRGQYDRHMTQVPVTAMTGYDSVTGGVAVRL
jgi:hypothetical protein